MALDVVPSVHRDEEPYQGQVRSDYPRVKIATDGPDPGLAAFLIHMQSEQTYTSLYL